MNLDVILHGDRAMVHVFSNNTTWHVVKAVGYSGGTI